MVVAVPPESVELAVASLASAGIEAWRVGEVVQGNEAGGLRYTEATR
jgi:hypothetical protein